VQTSNKILDDLARVANGAVTTLVGIKDEVDAVVRQRIESLIADTDLISREEFEVVRQLAANARAAQEKLEKRVAVLEAKSSHKPGAKARAKPHTPPKAAPKSTPDGKAK